MVMSTVLSLHTAGKMMTYAVRSGVIGHYVLLEWRLFGFVALESHYFSWSCLPRSCEYCIMPCVWLPHDPSR